MDEQRLIYSGQLMFDHFDLRSVLRHPSENNSYTIHLVCSPPHPSTKSTNNIPTPNLPSSLSQTSFAMSTDTESTGW